MASEQDEVIAFLADPSSYRPQPATVERIDTHGAIVFLAGDTAYKIKRAVHLPYLDFSTLERRQRFCRHEVEINAVTAPGIYLGVVPIVRRADGRLALGGDGEAVEWAVEMSRFEQAFLFDQLARAGKLELHLMVRLADHIAAFHARAPSDTDADGEARIAEVIASTTAALDAAVEVIPRQRAADYAREVLEALRRDAALLRLRAAQGYVRRCHGDMHLQNIVLDDGEPTLFDAIEFDDALATIDVLYDLAFLLMDLWHRGLKRHANVLSNRYLEACGDGEQIRGLAALPLFLSCRAAVRAMVTLDRLPHLHGPARRAAGQEARGYFESARAFLAPAPPRLVSVAGLSGTGKSTLAASLAPLIGGAPGALHLRSDVLRKRMLGVQPTERLGPEGYTPELTERVYREMCRQARMALEAGHSALIDAASLSLEHRDMIESLARRTNVAFCGLWLTADGARLIARVEQRKGDASDADASVVRAQLTLETGPVSWNVVDAGGPPDQTLQAAKQALEID